MGMVRYTMPPCALGEVEGSWVLQRAEDEDEDLLGTREEMKSGGEVSKVLVLVVVVVVVVEG